MEKGESESEPSLATFPLETLCFRFPVGPVEIIWLQLYQNLRKTVTNA